MAARLLVLFDIDGTLLLDDAYAHGRAMVRAMREVWGVDLPDDVVERIEPWGKTDVQIARASVATAAVGDEAFGAGRDAWIDAAARVFEDEVDAVAPSWVVRDGLRPALERLAEQGHRLTLVTGNLRRIAAAKLRAMALVDCLDVAIGAYGEDAEDRADLVPLARSRAGAGGEPWQRASTALVGDTPGDVTAARADGVAAVAFESPRHNAATLAGATRVVGDVDALLSALADLSDGRA